MKRLMVGKPTLFCGATREVASVLAVLALILSVGCSSKPEHSNSSQESFLGNKNTVSDNTTSTSSDGTLPQDRLSGNIEYDVDMIKLNKRDDDEEILPNRITANLAASFSGYAEKEADALRNEILNTENTEKIYKITGTKYYISPGGNDANSGTSPDNAFRTIEVLSAINLNPGDAVLFERNSVFRWDHAFTAEKGVTYGSYGVGEKPKIYGSPKNFAKETWKPSKKKNVWYINYVYKKPCQAVFEHGIEVGYLKISLRDVNKNTDFYYDAAETKLYLYCDRGKPEKVYKDIEIAGEYMGIIVPAGVNNVTIDNICFKYFGNGGISFWFMNTDGKVTNCELGYTGGASSGNVRAGNAIGSWAPVQNMQWDHNWVYQTFDSAISPQGLSDETTIKPYENISISNNLLEYNNGDIEIFERNEKNGTSFKDIYLDNNICRFTSMGWGTREDDGGIRGIEGVLSGHIQNLPVEGLFTFRNNIIDCPARDIFNWVVSPQQWLHFDYSGTKLYYKKSLRTTDLVVNGSQRNETDVKRLFVTNQNELTSAVSRFDPTAVIKWYE